MEARTLFANGLAKEVLVTLGEAGRAGGFTLNRARPARSVSKDAVGVELGGDGRAGYRERVAVGGAGMNDRRSVGVEDGHSSTIGAVGRRSSVAEPVDAGDYASKGVVGGALSGEADLRGKVGLPCGRLPTKGVVFVACREPRDVGHVEWDQTRRSDYAPFVVVVPSSSRAVWLNLRNLVTAVPSRGRHLTGEIFERRALAFGIVCHAVSGDSMNSNLIHLTEFSTKKPYRSHIATFSYL